MDRRKRLAIGALILLPAALLVYILHTDEIDERLPARVGGTLSADLELGSGLSFHRGSLEISSHAAEDVRVTAAVSGWGKYAVDLQATERDGDVRVVGRVDGFLHWIFAGPGVDVKILVPRGYRVQARIDGGPMVLEDLSGGVEARAEEGGRNTLTIRRVAGVVKLASEGGEVDVEKVEGPLKVELVGGHVRARGIEGIAVVATRDGGTVEIEDVVGDVHVASRHGRIRLVDIDGDLDIETEDASVEVEDLAGRIHARARHGDIDVEFANAPAGSIETRAGSIEIQVPRGASFDLAASVGRGSIDLDDDLKLVAEEPPTVSLGPGLENNLEDAQEMGLEIAAEVRDKVLDRVQREIDRHRGGVESDDDPRDWDWNWSWDDPQWRWHHHEWAEGDWVEWGDRRGGDASVGRELHGAVNGGGETLRIVTRAGRIEIDD